MTKAKTPKTEKPERTGDTRREGKRSVNWQDDPEILQRLAKVAVSMNRNKRSFEIAQELSVSLATAKRDIARVRVIWKQDAKERLEHSADTAIAQYGAVLGQSWEDVQNIPARSPVRVAFMNVILRAQERIDKVTGIADRVEHSGPGGGPIEHKVVDVEKIRAKRWQQVAPGLAALQNKESTNEPTPTSPEADKKPE